MDCKRLLLLMSITLLYMVIGMFIFRCLELDNEKRKRARMEEDFMDFIANHSCIDMADLLHILDIVGDQAIPARIVLANRSIYLWDYAGSLHFVSTVVTTIGYGHLAPTTSSGKIMTVVYALFGIPLTLIMLKNIGEKLHRVAKRLYKVRYCDTAWINNTINVVILVLVGVSLVMVLPSFLFIYTEGWTMVEALYYCFITLSTIGFGDYMLKGGSFYQTYHHDLYRVFIYVWTLFGLVHVSLVITTISNTLVKKANSVEKHTKMKLEAEARRLRLEIMKYRQNSLDITNDTVEGTVRVDSLDVRLLKFDIHTRECFQNHPGGDNNQSAVVENEQTSCIL